MSSSESEKTILPVPIKEKSSESPTNMTTKKPFANLTASSPATDLILIFTSIFVFLTIAFIAVEILFLALDGNDVQIKLGRYLMFGFLFLILIGDAVAIKILHGRLKVARAVLVNREEEYAVWKTLGCWARVKFLVNLRVPVRVGDVELAPGAYVAPYRSGYRR